MVHGFSNGHVLLVSSQGSTFVIIKKSRRLGQGDIVIFIEILGSGLPVSVGCLVLVHKHEWLFFVPFVFHPIEGTVSDDIRGVTHMLDDFIMLTVPIFIQSHPWVVIGSLADQNFRVVISLWGHMSPQMPLPNHCGGVSCLSEQFGEGLLGAIELISIYQEAVGMGVFSGLDCRSHRTAN